MKSLRLAISVLAGCVAAMSMHSQPQSVGLVLSGGGAKGIAHIGVIQAFEDNDIPIDYITGTSMGAIVGGLYAAGYSPQRMLELILSPGFSYWSTGQIDPSQVYYFTTETPTPVIATIPITTKRDSLQQVRSAVPASVISPLPMSFAFMELFSGATAVCGGDFNKLFVPFRCVASDVAAKHKVVFRSGRLADAVRSSMSFPIIFQPCSVDGMTLYDGGIYDNFPVNVMKADFAPDIMIGVDVSTEATGPQTSLMDQLENMVIQNNDYSLPADEGIKIKIDLNQFGLLDFPQANAIYKIGYDKAMSMIDSIKGRVTSRVPKQERELRRAMFNSQIPYIRFDSVTVTGGTPQQNTYIEYLFTGSKEDTISIDHARRSFYRAISPGKLRQLTPTATYNDSTDLYSLALAASVKDNLSVGVGGYITSSTSSYVYLQANYSTLSFSSVASSLGAWIGQSYLGAMLNSRLYLRTKVPSALELQAVAFRQKYYQSDYLFFEEKTPSYILDHEYYGRLKWAWAAGSLNDMEAGVGFGHLYDTFYQPNQELGYLSDRDRCYFNLWQAYLKYESNTLDDLNYPTQGRYYKFNLMGVAGRFRHDSQIETKGHEHLKWLQFEIQTRNFFTIGRHFSLGLESDIMLSTRKLVRDYNASIVAAPAFQPMPSCYNNFDEGFRANSFVAVGLSPIYKYNSNLSMRIAGYCFVPIRSIQQDSCGVAVYDKKWFTHPEYFAELDVCYKLPFATVAAYLNYSSTPVKDWKVGLSFGVFLPAPRYLR